MIVSESSRTRRFVGRLDRGTDLLNQLADVCRTHGVRAGEVRAVGTVDDVVLGQRRLDGAFELVTFAGTLLARSGAPSVQAAVTLARDDGSLVGGRLAAARVVACEFVVDAFDDVAPAATTGAAAPTVAPALAVAVAPAVAAPAEATPRRTEDSPTKPVPMFDPPARTSWSDVMRASEHKSAPAGEVAAVEEEPLPPPTGEPVQVQAGDFIDHPKFGRVAVERVDSDQEFVTARLRNQRLIRLSLDVLTLIPAGQAEGKNLFRAVAGK